MDILIVDDIDSFRDDIKKVIGGIDPGVRIKEASTYYDAIQLISEYTFDIMILDLRLSDDDKECEKHLIAKIKIARQYNKNVKVIIASAYLTSDFYEILDEKGMYELEFVKKEGSWLKDLTYILNKCMNTSERGKQLEQERSIKFKNKKFDVFLCHNSEDKPYLRILYKELKQRLVNPWFDEKHVPPGRLWQVELEEQINEIGSAAVFVGKNGIALWQNIEIRAFLSEFINRGCPLIPVILPDAQTVPTLPIFLKQLEYIDLRRDYQEGIKRLCEAIKNESPPEGC